MSSSNWEVKTAGKDAFQPLADVLGIQAVDIVAALRDSGDLVSVLYTKNDDIDMGYQAILEMNEKTRELTIVSVREIPEFQSIFNTLMGGEGADDAA